MRVFHILLKFPIDLILFLLDYKGHKSIIIPNRKIKLFYLTSWTSTNKEDLCAQMKRTKMRTLAWFDSKFISYNDACVSFSSDGIQCFRAYEYLKTIKRKSHWKGWHFNNNLYPYYIRKIQMFRQYASFWVDVAVFCKPD